MSHFNIFKMTNHLMVLFQISGQSTPTKFQPFSDWLTDVNLWSCKGFTSEGWKRLRWYVIKLYFSRGRRSAGLLGLQFTACRWDDWDMVSLLLAEPGLRRWQQVLFDVDVLCRVSVSASTYDLHYDQRRNACWWTTGDLVQTGEGGEVQEEMEEGQQMESGVEGDGSAEASRQADSGDRRLSVRIHFFFT